MICYGSYPSPYGVLIIGCCEGAVVSVKLSADAAHPNQPCAASDQAAAQLQEYFNGSRKEFHFPVSIHGTPFQIAVWQAIQQIPYGETRSYGQIASTIGKPNAARAVGQAANRNPLWIVVPCHRVVGKDQALTGYAGGLDIKRQLLELERTHQ